jgi:hypothetical protein
MESTNTLLDREYATDQLDVAERARLQELESIVEHGLQTFYEVGKALEEIREQKLYRETHKTFEAYCQEKWGMARQTANRFIGAARVMEILEPIGSKIPTKESQIRPLAQLPPELQIKIWQEAVESSPNGIPTGAAVKRLVEERFPSDGSGRSPKDSASELEKLRSDNQRLREQLRAENRQLKAQLRQRDKDWEVRLAAERVKIREEVRAQMKAEYEGKINSLTHQLAEMTANYHGVLARLTALEKGK